MLERDEHAITTVEALTRIESVLAQSQAGNASAIASKADHETQFVLQEIRLLVRELAMVQNAQILARVAAQLKSQPHQFR